MFLHLFVKCTFIACWLGAGPVRCTENSGGSLPSGSAVLVREPHNTPVTPARQPPRPTKTHQGPRMCHTVKSLWKKIICYGEEAPLHTHSKPDC